MGEDCTTVNSCTGPVPAPASDRDHCGVLEGDRERGETPMIVMKLGIKKKRTGPVIPGMDAEGVENATLNGQSLRGRDLRGAYLKGADLNGADLKGLDLEGADLSGADLREANLEEANLRCADLEGAQLGGAILKRTTLWDANLRNADLAGARDLLPESLAGADLSSAALPDSVCPSDAVSHANELSRNAGRLLVALLTACAYAVVTILGTKDAQLLKLSGTAKLPIVDTEIPLLWFYLVVPAWLLGLYTYFHLYLQRLWEELSRLPAVFCDGRPVDQKIDPWLLNGLARTHSKRLQDQRQSLSLLQTSLSTLVGWWALPISLWVFVSRYSSRLLWLDEPSDWAWVGLQVVSLMLAVWISLTLRHMGVATLRREPAGPPQPKSPFRQRDTYRRAVTALMVVLVVCPLSLLVRSQFPANLQNADLRGVHLLGASLVRARLQGAQLDSAHLDRAQLPAAHLEEAHLEGAHLTAAKLSGSHLEAAHLREAEFSSADLRGADLTGADCQKAVFTTAVLSGASLKGSLLAGADLIGTVLRGADLTQASLEGANLFQAQLQQALLHGANLRHANLQHANLEGAHLDGAFLQGADLSSAEGLTAAQLRTSFRDAATKLPAALRGAVPINAGTAAALPLSSPRQPGLIISRLPAVSRGDLP
jgi:uncharacterized protein YjbI with pentapeptide repeats